jgi:transketolase
MGEAAAAPVEPEASILATVHHLRPVPDPKPPPSPIAGEAPSIRQLERWATVLRMDCVRMLAVAKSGHLDSSLSAADIVTALYNRVLRHDPANPDWPDRDRFVLSKGHAAPILYAALARHDYFPLEDLMGLRKIGAQLQGHPDMHKTAGVEVSTGSLGQGLSMALGISLALHLDGREAPRTFALLSDGDCQEGQTWEAATAAPHFAERGGGRLTAIVDYNHLQTDGTTEEVMDIGDMRAKFAAFGWDVVEIDGHDMAAIVEALERTRDLEQPAAIIAQTKKGRGVSSMEGRFGFHGKPPTPEQADEALTELEALYKEQTAALGGTGEFEKVPATSAGDTDTPEEDS